MKTKTLELTEIQINQLEKQLSHYPSRMIQHALFSYILPQGFITAYTSKKVLFQGDFALKIANQFEKELQESAGSDEVGTGDYFGPVVVCAVLIQEKDFDLLKKLTIMDSKGLSDDQILEIAPELMNSLTYSLLVLDNLTYNRIHQTMNMNAIKANLHQKAYDHLKKKAGYLPELCVIDQFMDPKHYFSVLTENYGITNLHFETKAENKYPAVACASIIARFTFLQALVQLSEKVGFILPKGAGTLVDEKARDLLKQNPALDFKQIAKLHFKNTQRIFNQR